MNKKMDFKSQFNCFYPIEDLKIIENFKGITREIDKLPYFHCQEVEKVPWELLFLNLSGQ